MSDTKQTLWFLITPTNEGDGRWDAHGLDFGVVATRADIYRALRCALDQCHTTWMMDRANGVDSFAYRGASAVDWARQANVVAFGTHTGPGEMCGGAWVARVETDLRVGATIDKLNYWRVEAEVF